MACRHCFVYRVLHFQQCRVQRPCRVLRCDIGFYSRWGITGRRAFAYCIFQYGDILAWAAGAWRNESGVWCPPPATLPVFASNFVRPLGWILVAISAGYIIATAIRREPIRIFSCKLRAASAVNDGWRLRSLQYPPPTGCWPVSVFYVLLPRDEAPFLAVLGAFLGAQILGLASHVPGGVGVFEGLMVLLLDPYFTSAEFVPALVVFRAVYYLAPLSVALVLLVGDEIRRRRAHAAKVTAYLGRLTERLAPMVLAIFTFIGGVVLLFSGATPVSSGTARISQSRVAAGDHRNVSCCGQCGWRSSAAVVSRTCQTARCGVLLHGCGDDSLELSRHCLKAADMRRPFFWRAFFFCFIEPGRL